jgi:hypothetical protein
MAMFYNKLLLPNPPEMREGKPENKVAAVKVRRSNLVF